MLGGGKSEYNKARLGCQIRQLHFAIVFLTQENNGLLENQHHAILFDPLTSGD